MELCTRIAYIALGTEGCVCVRARACVCVCVSLVLRVRRLYVAPSLGRWYRETCLDPRALSLSLLWTWVHSPSLILLF